MNCICGHNETSMIMLNRHRRNCADFWRGVYDEMARISTMLYGRIVPIAIAEWDSYHSERFPKIKSFRDWGRTWTQVQEESGHGTSPLGRGAAVAKGAPVKQSRWDRLSEFPDYTGTYSAFDDLVPSSNLAVCTDTFERTGRMILR